ncbi:MAG: hypothetical protein LH481_07005 [Burkholderiales bacterium]|nr:hypothetical protein [Burkholderiales bacterium]
MITNWVLFLSAVKFVRRTPSPANADSDYLAATSASRKLITGVSAPALQI